VWDYRKARWLPVQVSDRTERGENMNGDIDPTRREQADYNDTRRPRWRLPIIAAGAGIGMLIWLLLAHIIPK
jgi:hypothetical protein